jgi:hypothetical protein
LAIRPGRNVNVVRLTDAPHRGPWSAASEAEKELSSGARLTNAGVQHASVALTSGHGLVSDGDAARPRDGCCRAPTPAVQHRCGRRRHGADGRFMLRSSASRTSCCAPERTTERPP